jgi:replicative DNA helicase
MGGVYIYGAGTGAGKSTEFREDAVFVMGLGFKVGYIALEETIGQTLQTFLSILCNKLDPSVEEQKEAFAKVRGKFFLYDHFSQRDITGLMAKIRYMVVAEGCNIVYLDHMTAVIVASDTEEDRVATDHFMGAVSALAVELKVPIMVVSHLSRREKTNHESGDQITLKDFRGSHSIPQYATGVLAIERDQQAGHDSDVDVSIIRRLKHRWRGRLGEADTMQYSHKTGRYLPAAELALQEGF